MMAQELFIRHKSDAMPRMNEEPHLADSSNLVSPHINPDSELTRMMYETEHNGFFNMSQVLACSDQHQSSLQRHSHSQSNHRRQRKRAPVQDP